MNHYKESQGLHLNYDLLLDMVENNSKVLDLGCGDGYLLKLLKFFKTFLWGQRNKPQEGILQSYPLDSRPPLCLSSVCRKLCKTWHSRGNTPKLWATIPLKPPRF